VLLYNQRHNKIVRKFVQVFKQDVESVHYTGAARTTFHEGFYDSVSLSLHVILSTWLMLADVRIYRPWMYDTTLFVTGFIIINAFKQKPDTNVYSETHTA